MDGIDIFKQINESVWVIQNMKVGILLYSSVSNSVSNSVDNSVYRAVRTLVDHKIENSVESAIQKYEWK